MKKLYQSYIGKMEKQTISPVPELSPFIESYFFYENEHIKDEVSVKVIPNGKVELFIQYDDSEILMVKGQKEIRLGSFVVGISQLEKATIMKPTSRTGALKGVAVRLTWSGVAELLRVPLKSLTNKILHLEAILGKQVKLLTDQLALTGNNIDRETILNEFFSALLNRKKKAYERKFSSIRMCVN